MFQIMEFGQAAGITCVGGCTCICACCCSSYESIDSQSGEFSSSANAEVFKPKKD